MCPNPIVNVPIRNRIVQVQSEQAANSGVVRISTHNREGHSPRVRSYLAYLYCYYSKPYQFVLKENLFFQRSPNPRANVPRNRIVQGQSEQAANSGAVRRSTHNRDIVVALSVAPPLSITETGSAASIVD